MVPPATAAGLTSAAHFLTLLAMREPEALRGEVPASYVRLLWEYLQARGHAPERLLGEPPPRPPGPGPGRFPVTRWKTLLERAARALSAPDLGLHLGRTAKPRHFGVIGYVAHACETLGAALQRFDHYQRLVYDVSPMHISAEKGVVILEWGTESGRPGRLVDEAAISALVQVARDMTAHHAPIPHVQFVNPPPDDLAPFEAWFGGEVRFAQATTQVHLPLEFLALPLQHPDRALRELLEQQADSLLTQLPGAGDLEQAVRRAVTEAAGERDLSLAFVAERVHVSPRTLHRRLAALGLGFRELRDDTRRRLAEQHLADPGLGIAEVAQLLGYSEQSAFTRAFRNWTGQAPASYRRQLPGSARG